MGRLLIRRILLGIVVTWVVSMMIFAATELLPGDVCHAVLGQGATEKSLESCRERLQLNQPMHTRYLQWLGRLATGELGTSLANDLQISDQIGARAWNTVRLAALTALIAVPLAVLLGLIAAIRADSSVDRGISIGTLCFISVPEFFTGVLLVYILAVQLRWMPAVANYRDLTRGDFLEVIEALALPIATLTFAVLAHMTRMTRTAVLNVMSSPYIEQAILKGASRSRVIIRHALPNAVAPIVNVIALNLAYLVSGVVVVEAIFRIPGLGTLMVESVIYRDIPTVQAIGMLFCVTYVGFNLIADVMAIIANPRLRHPR
ncbi:MAG TPA: ABC transporter permease [Gammaproteobacteria bacterium]|jgi:peptide/nickel transport system permease protein|nr:ABC transporter permease [Acidiferrobacter sp.]MEC9078844.1 ABC transporter permease [Pseudomonadota bacterium]MED5250157.1 ABC transporter permease [Pseudomonadota bacterium]HAA36685.1 ABC transporter permease [Gammaproteobacteria bacterium]HAF74318.1 ABC transporter permease [Gammaproteobacteria bacterium]|tara:strand:+ start:919 stop:1872 length:954 start_codon:yes stop_codon:yes gene_type:complete